jgi:hypothetical protein
VDRQRAQAASPTAGERSSEDPGADKLVAGQYADRPHLRPVLDTVLAALPECRHIYGVAETKYPEITSRAFSVFMPATDESPAWAALEFGGGAVG